MKRVASPIRGGENGQEAAEGRPDGRYTESVDGLTWNFEVKGGKSFIGCAELSSLSGGGLPALAAGSDADGAVVIPSFLGGHPVTGIGSNAFWLCGRKITSIVIPESVTVIGVWAFHECEGLTSVTISDSVTCIKEGAFHGCSGLKSFHVGERNVAYVSVDGLLLTKDGKTLVEGVSGDVAVPSSVKVIGAYAFSGCSLTSLTIPDGVTSIGYSAFYGCGLTSVTIPHGVTKIEDWTFRRCGRLASISIPSSVTSIGAAAFYKCSRLEEMTIPSSVTSIGDEAFSGCFNCKSINISEGVMSIGRSAFYFNTRITSLTIPSSVVSIGMGAFDCAESLESVTIKSENIWFDGNPFTRCGKLEKWSLPHSNAPFVLRDNLLLTKDGKTLVAGQAARGDVIIPSSVTSIGDGAFYGCMGLMSVTIPDSVTSIGAYAFAECAGLKSVRIPYGVTSIGSHAFSRCHGLMSVSIPHGVASIGEDAFGGCDNLESDTKELLKARWPKCM